MSQQTLTVPSAVGVGSVNVTLPPRPWFYRILQACYGCSNAGAVETAVFGMSVAIVLNSGLEIVHESGALVPPATTAVFTHSKGFGSALDSTGTGAVRLVVLPLPDIFIAPNMIVRFGTRASQAGDTYSITNPIFVIEAFDG